MPANPLDDAKAALVSANKFQSSAGGALPKPKAAPAAAAPAPKSKAPTLGDELAAKQANIDSYRQAYIQNYKAKGGQ